LGGAGALSWGMAYLLVMLLALLLGSTFVLP
jgi:hypothetical protein